jgi:hypothetical protein
MKEYKKGILKKYDDIARNFNDFNIRLKSVEGSFKML